MRSRVVAVGIAALALVPLSGCGVEQTGGTYQSASGNGVETKGAGVEVDNATIVSGTEGSGDAAFLATVFNVTAAEDQLIAIIAGDAGAKLKPDPIPLPPGRGVVIQTGRDAEAVFDGLAAKPGTYLPVRMIFRTAGEVSFNALVVPPYGFYRDAAPAGTRIEPEPTPTNEMATEEPAQ